MKSGARRSPRAKRKVVASPASSSDAQAGTEVSEELADSIRTLRALVRIGASLPLAESDAVSKKSLEKGQPPGPSLGSMIARHVDPSTPGTIVMIGGMTGADEIASRGANPRRFLFVDSDDAECERIRRAYPASRVIKADPLKLRQIIGKHLPQSASALVSGLSLLTETVETRVNFLRDVLAILRPGCPFVVLSLGEIPVFPKELIVEESAEVQPFHWLETVGGVIGVPSVRVLLYYAPEPSEFEFGKPTGVGSQLKPPESVDDISLEETKTLRNEFASRVASEIAQDSLADQRAFLRSVARQLGLEASFTTRKQEPASGQSIGLRAVDPVAVEIAAEVTMKWSDRRKAPYKDQPWAWLRNADLFIAHVYKKWLDAKTLRLKHLEPTLREAYLGLVRRHPHRRILPFNAKVTKVNKRLARKPA
jgi:phospholipid N-methyltransferase